jgi:hypothetical protein
MPSIYISMVIGNKHHHPIVLVMHSIIRGLLPSFKITRGLTEKRLFPQFTMCGIQGIRLAVAIDNRN